MAAHTGRCFRSWRRTKTRKARQGLPWDFPIRQGVPLALRAFLTGSANQKSAGAGAMKLAIARYAQHQIMVGNVGRPGAARGR
jgi:hypothetical protein